MQYARLALVLCVTAIGWSCAHNAPSLVPLGHGPLSQAERRAAALLPASRRNLDPSGAATPTREPEPQRPPSPEPSTRSQDKSASDPRPDPNSVTTASDSSVSSKDGASKDGHADLDAWLGLYRGNDTTTFRLPEQPDRRFDDAKAKIRVEQAAKGRLKFALVDSSNDKDICQLTATVEGNSATVDAGQACFLDPDEELEVRSRPGKAIRNDRRLTFDLVLDTTMDSEVGKLDGTIEYHFEGQR